jgi:hypothetical protein
VDTASGVSGSVEYDAELLCVNDHDPKRMHPQDETSVQGNTIYECPECGNRRAVNLHVAPLGGGSS